MRLFDFFRSKKTTTTQALSKPDTQAEAILFYLQGTLTKKFQPKNDKESERHFNKRAQNHQIKNLRKLLDCLVKCSDKKNFHDLESVGDSTNNKNIQDILSGAEASTPEGEAYQARLAALYSLMVHVGKHELEIKNNTRLRIGRYIRHDKEGKKIMSGLGLPQNKDDKTTIKIQIPDGFEKLFDQMGKYHKAIKAETDINTKMALEKFKPRKAWWWHRFGKFLAVFVALAVLLTLLPFTAQFLASLGLAAAIAYPIATLFASAGAWVNFKLFRNMVPDTLLDFFAFGPLFSSKKTYYYENEALDGRKTQEVKTYTGKQSAATAICTFFVLVASGVAGIFTFMGVKTILAGAVAAASIGSGGMAIVPIALVFAGVLFSVYACLYLKSYTKLIQGGNITKAIKLHLAKMIRKITAIKNDKLKKGNIQTNKSGDALTEKQTTLAKTIFWTLYVFTFLIAIVGALMSGYAAAIGSFLSGTPILAYTLCMGVNTLAVAGFAATSCAFVAEKASRFIFYALDSIGMNKLPSFLIIPLTVLVTLIIATSAPAWFPFFVIGYGIDQYLKVANQHIMTLFEWIDSKTNPQPQKINEGQEQSTTNQSIPQRLMGLIKKVILRPVLIALSPLWLPIRLLVKIEAVNAADTALNNGTSDESSKNTKEPFSKTQFFLIFVNALPNAAQYLNGVTSAVNTWFSGVGSAIKSILMGIATMPGYLFSLFALFTTPYSDERDKYAKDSDGYTVEINDTFSHDNENKANASPEVKTQDIQASFPDVSQTDATTQDEEHKVKGPASNRTGAGFFGKSGKGKQVLTISLVSDETKDTVDKQDEPGHEKS